MAFVIFGEPPIADNRFMHNRSSDSVGSECRRKQIPGPLLRPAIGWLAAIAILAGSLTGCVGMIMRDLTPIETKVPHVRAPQRQPLTPRRPFTALFVAGASGTEITDLFAPWAILVESGLFDAKLVAASRAPVPITGRLFALPDTTFADAPPAELIVVPAVADHEEAALLGWLRQRANGSQRLLVICDGARVAAAAGVLDGRRATTHAFSLAATQRRHPSIQLLTGHRYVEDGPIISSAGVTSGIDAALYAVERFGGSAAATGAAHRLGIDWHREPDVHGTRQADSSFDLNAKDYATILANTIRRPFRTSVAVHVEPGVSEIALAAVLDAFPRTLRAQVLPFTDGAELVSTAHGLRIATPHEKREALGADLQVLLPASDHLVQPSRALGVLDLRGALPGMALAQTLTHIEHAYGTATARFVAKMIEAPFSS